MYDNDEYRWLLPEDIYARIVAAYYAGTLNNKDYKNASLYIQEHEMLTKKANEIISKFKSAEGRR